MSFLSRLRIPALCTCMACCLGACGLLLGLDEFTDQPAGSGGEGGTGGSAACAPSAEEACYSGPQGSRDVGECRGGGRTCSDDGTWGACEGEVLPAVERCEAPSDENCDSFECIVWATAYDQEGIVEPYGIAADSDGNALVVGIFTGTITIAGQTLSSAGSSDGLLVKLSPNGEVLWAKKFGDILDDAIMSVTADTKGDVILVARTTAEVDFGGGPVPAGLVVVKLDASGQHVWSTSFGGSGYLVDVVVDANDDVIVAGAFSEPIDVGQGPISPVGGQDIVVAKIRGTTGAVTDPGSWARMLGSAASESAWSVAVDGSQNIFVAGTFAGTLDFGGVGGVRTANGVDAFVLKLTPGGSTSWIEVLGGAGEQEATGIVVDASGRPVVVGAFFEELLTGGEPVVSAGGDDAFVVQHAASGTVLWTDSFGDASNQGAKSVAIDPVGNIVVSGYAAGQIDFGGGALGAAGDIDAFVAKLSPEGAHVWSRLLGTDAEDISWAVAGARTGETLMSLTTRAAMADFGTGPLPGRGNGGSGRLVVTKHGL